MTREEAIKCIKVIESEYNREHRNTDISDVVDIDIDSVDIEALDMAIKALEAENVLDKIRAEIVHLHDWAFSREEILRIIDKYKAESEE